ncbi:MAG TPA: hypothetical protein VHF05_02395 [Candidatus Paceibacterota bacterium]|nr:hypothetical protein [Candidatus Paceibacterota bacterium]
MKTYTLRVRSVDKKIFDALESGAKNVETRAASSKYAGMRAGDAITFVCGKERLTKAISSAKIYKSLPALLRDYKPSDINPAAKTARELDEMYASFPGYEAKIRRFGIIALELE